MFFSSMVLVAVFTPSKFASSQTAPFGIVGFWTSYNRHVKRLQLLQSTVLI